MRVAALVFLWVVFAVFAVLHGVLLVIGLARSDPYTMVRAGVPLALILGTGALTSWFWIRWRRQFDDQRLQDPDALIVPVHYGDNLLTSRGFLVADRKGLRVIRSKSGRDRWSASWDEIREIDQSVRPGTLGGPDHGQVQVVSEDGGARFWVGTAAETSAVHDELTRLAAAEAGPRE